MLKQMNHRLVLLFLAVLILPVAPLGAQETSSDPDEVLVGGDDTKVFPSVGTIEKEKSRLRKGPGFEYDSVSRFERGTELLVIDTEGEWYLVTLPSAPEKPLGWVHKSLIKLSDKEPVEPAAPVATAPESTPTPQPEATPVPEPVTAAPTPTPEPTPAPEPVKPTVVEDPTERPKPLQRFQGDTRYAVPQYRGGHEVLFQINPGFNSVIENRNGQLEDDAVRLRLTAAAEVAYSIFVGADYSYVAYKPGQPTHEVGGNVRYQHRLFWRFKPYVDAGVFYSTLFDDDNIGARGSLGLNFVLGGQTYEWNIGPSIEFNRVFMGAPGDVDNLFVGLSIVLSDVLADD